MTTKGSRGPCRALIREILGHLVQYPDAKDTADGIQRFWLSAQTLNRGRKEVREALDFLVVTKGWLIERKAGSSEKLYSLAKDHLEEIKNFLRPFESDH